MSVKSSKRKLGMRAAAVSTLSETTGTTSDYNGGSFATYDNGIRNLGHDLYAPHSGGSYVWSVNTNGSISDSNSYARYIETGKC